MQTRSVEDIDAVRALIRTRAAEAGIPASTYIRRCVLEVEQSRAQAREAVAVMDCKASAPVQAPSTKEGHSLVFFARLARHVGQC